MSAKRAPKAQLGINTKFASIVTYETIEAERENGASRERISLLYHALKWRRLGDIQKLFPLHDNLKRGFRTAKCYKVQISPIIEIHYSDKTKRARYGRGLMVCGARWICPVCGARITELERAELERVDFDGLGLGVCLTTNTLAHHMSDTCEKVLGLGKEAWRKVKSGRAYQDFVKQFGIVGSITNTDFTYSFKNGFHAHQHTLLIYKKESSTIDVNAVKEILFKLYISALEKMGGYASFKNGLDVIAGDNASIVAQYVAKFGREPKEKTWTVQAELTKGASGKGAAHGHYTMLQMIDLWCVGNKQAGAKFVEYAKATKGRQQLIYSRGLRKTLGLGAIKRDMEKARRDDPMTRIFAMLTTEDWKQIVKLDTRGEVLRAGFGGDFARFRDALARMGVVIRDLDIEQE